MNASRFFLVDRDGGPADPAVLVTAVPNWSIGETFSIATGARFRIVDIRTDVASEVAEAGFNGVFVVEPL
jgi:hypothetical protein